MSTLPSIPANVVYSTGPLFIGYIMNWALCGVLTVQAYQYHTGFPRDPWSLKSLVYGVYILSVIQTFIITASGFHTFGYGYGDMRAIDEMGIGWQCVPFLAGIVGFLAQSFYAYRIRRLTNSLTIPSVVMLLSVVQLVTGIFITYKMHLAQVWSKYPDKVVLIVAIPYGFGSALCDVVIAVCMIYYLRKRDTQITQTQALVTRIIRLTVATGALTALVAIMTIILVYIRHPITYYLSFAAIWDKVYSNAMLANLNGRRRDLPPDQWIASEGGGFRLSTMQAKRSTVPLDKQWHVRSTHDDGIHVHKEVHTSTMDSGAI